jgi:hypothetical protein
VDGGPFFLSLWLVNYAGDCTNTTADKLTIEIEGCRDAETLTPCVADETTVTMEMSYDSVPICNVTLYLPANSDSKVKLLELQNEASFSFIFSNPTFYATHVIYKVSTRNDGIQTSLVGNSILSGVVRPPSGSSDDGNILRVSSTINIDSTVSVLQNCDEPQPDNSDPFISTTSSKCHFNQSSTKEFSLQGNTTEKVAGSLFYESDKAGYEFRINIVKNSFFKLTTFDKFVNIGEVTVWVILFSFGNIGLIQVLAMMILRCFEIGARLRNKFGFCTEPPAEDIDLPDRGGRPGQRESTIDI